MDLFQFTMQQLAPHPAVLSEGSIPAIRPYLLNWLRRYHPGDEPRLVFNHTHLLDDLGLSGTGKGALIADLEDFYEIQIPAKKVNSLHTVLDLETCLQQSLTRFAA
ncbi:hypothetical protein [Hymenobacter terricola]|uniref:hypothetical protein n=1 Tax=Hymenobacter terricola TaxID=2819236 RepID=UPI001B316BC9|nr:hypothetical protein [Hymenobacter terricola]